MEIFTKNNFIRKIVIIFIVFIIIFNALMPTKSYAGKLGDIVDYMSGGLIAKPFSTLLVGLADGIWSLITEMMLGEEVGILDYLDKSDLLVTDDTPANVIQNIVDFIPYYPLSPETIFTGNVDILDVNFINENENNDSSWNVLRNTVKAWYRALRLLAIVGLLSILIYIGIRIMLSSNSSKQASYKQRLLDWVVAFVILFSMPYIMSFTFTVTDELIGLFAEKNENTGKIEYNNIIVGDSSGRKFRTNIMGIVRLKLEFVGGEWKFSTIIGYTFTYIAIIGLTVKFVIIYLKRAFTIAFLTIISPIVAMMYPLDKVSDGQAQGFQMWLKEFIFNVLIQPVHYLLYIIFIGSVASLAGSNFLYTIIALTFMTEGEKLLKQIFQFNKASGGTVQGTSAVGAAAIASGVMQLGKKIGAGKGEESKKSSDENQGLEVPKVGDGNGDDEEISRLRDEGPESGEPDETRTDETRTDETRTDETTTDETRTDDTRTDETTTDETRTDDTRTDKTTTDETRTDDTRTDKTTTDGKKQNNSAKGKYAKYGINREKNLLGALGERIVKKGRKILGVKQAMPTKQIWKNRAKKGIKSYAKFGAGLMLGVGSLAVSSIDGKPNVIESASAGLLGGRTVGNFATKKYEKARTKIRESMYGDESAKTIERVAKLKENDDWYKYCKGMGIDEEGKERIYGMLYSGKVDTVQDAVNAMKLSDKINDKDARNAVKNEFVLGAQNSSREDYEKELRKKISSDMTDIDKDKKEDAIKEEITKRKKEDAEKFREKYTDLKEETDNDKVIEKGIEKDKERAEKYRQTQPKDKYDEYAAGIAAKKNSLDKAGVSRKIYEDNDALDKYLRATGGGRKEREELEAVKLFKQIEMQNKKYSNSGGK